MHEKSGKHTVFWCACPRARLVLRMMVSARMCRSAYARVFLARQPASVWGSPYL